MIDYVQLHQDLITQRVDGIIVVFAKCPIPGSSKTRLENLLNADGAAQLAEAMLKDVIYDISNHRVLKSCLKIIVYAPGNNDGNSQITNILQKLGLKALSSEDMKIASIRNDSSWYLHPMAFDKDDKMKGENDLTSSNIGFKLATALTQIRKRVESLQMEENAMKNSAPIMFLGMDSPEMPLDEFAQAMLLVSENESKAYMNPAADGGYCMLMLPKTVPETVFDGIRWSCSLTAISQLKSLSDHGFHTVIGSIMNDIDQASDVYKLSQRLCIQYNSCEEKNHDENDDVEKYLKHDCLSLKSKPFLNLDTGRNYQRSFNTFHTFQMLKKLNLIRPLHGSETSWYSEFFDKIS